MTDIVDPVTRSRMMAGIRSRDTGPEVLVRSFLHRRGFRFARTSAGLPGRPDVVLPKWKAVVFVNGCFWHMHDCGLFRMPSSNRGFWENKLSANRRRDQKNMHALLAQGWKVVTVWECSLRGPDVLQKLGRRMDMVAAWIRSDTGNNCCELGRAGVTSIRYDIEGN